MLPYALAGLPPLGATALRATRLGRHHCWVPPTWVPPAWVPHLGLPRTWVLHHLSPHPPGISCTLGATPVPPGSLAPGSRHLPWNLAPECTTTTCGCHHCLPRSCHLGAPPAPECSTCSLPGSHLVPCLESAAWRHALGATPASACHLPGCHAPGCSAHWAATCLGAHCTQSAHTPGSPATVLLHLSSTCAYCRTAWVHHLPRVSHCCHCATLRSPPPPECHTLGCSTTWVSTPGAPHTWVSPSLSLTAHLDSTHLDCSACLGSTHAWVPRAPSHTWVHLIATTAAPALRAAPGVPPPGSAAPASPALGHTPGLHAPPGSTLPQVPLPGVPPRTACHLSLHHLGLTHT
ncbi:hypothetical protein GPJ56_007241 [Histomonas meleagridis]|nr:hypothetical protein GPJ56_007241 [Histomonas meleagridis]